MSQQNLLKLVLQKTRALNSWIIAFLTSLDLKTKAQRAIDVTKQALKKLRQLSTHLYQQARHAILLTARYLAKKNTIFRQWSHQNIAPRWARFVVFSKKSFKKFIAFVIWLLRTVTLQIKRLLIYTTIQLENLSKLTFNVLDYVVDNLLSLLVFITDKAILFSRIIAKAVWKGLKLLAGTVTLQIKRLLIYTAIQLENLSKLTFNILDYVVDNLLSLLVFIMDTAILFSRIIAKAVWKGLKLLAGYAAETALFLYLYAQKGLKLLAVYAAEVALFLYLFTQVALIVSIIALRRLNNLLRISTSRLRVYFKSFARFIHIHLVILLKLLDKAFKQAGAYLTIA